MRQLATALGVPDGVLAKAPSPNLWPDQKAKAELGADYNVIDLILWGIEHWWNTDDIAKDLGLPKEFVENIYQRWRGSEHKRCTPIIPKLLFRTVSHDFRLPYNP